MIWLLDPRAQRGALVATGVVLFILGAILLALEPDAVSWSVRLQAWPARLVGEPTPIRATGIRGGRGRLHPVARCPDDSGSARSTDVPAGHPALPLLLRVPSGRDTAEACLEIAGWSSREVSLRLPTPSTTSELSRAPAMRETEAGADRARDDFPFDWIAAPTSGRFNPSDPAARLLLWLRDAPGAGATVRTSTPGRAPEVVRPGPDGLYRLPLAHAGLGTRATVSVEGAGGRHERTFRLGLNPRPLSVSAERKARSVRVMVHRHDPRDGPTAAVCGLFLGPAALDVRALTFPVDATRALIELLVPDSVPRERALVVSCDPGVVAGGRDSATVLALDEDVLAGSLASLSEALRARLGSDPAALIQRWAAGDTVSRRRAHALATEILRPEPVRPSLASSSLDADRASAEASFARLRARTFGVLVGGLLLWILVVLVALWHQRRARILAAWG